MRENANARNRPWYELSDATSGRTTGEVRAGGANPTETDGLSLSPQAYVGDYEYEDWGTIHVRYDDGKLVGTQGGLTLDFESTGKDEFMLAYGTGEPDAGHFDIKNDRAVAAVVMQLYGEPYRFARR